jgi:hypothetical protein
LDHILCVGWIFQDAPRQSIKTLIVAAHDEFKRGAVAFS